MSYRQDRLNHLHQLQGGLFQLHHLGGGFIECSIDNVGPLDQRPDRFRIETKLRTRDVGDEFSARLAGSVEKFLSRFVGTKMRFICGREKRRLMMIKPPG